MNTEEIFSAAGLRNKMSKKSWISPSGCCSFHLEFVIPVRVPLLAAPAPAFLQPQGLGKIWVKTNPAEMHKSGLIQEGHREQRDELCPLTLHLRNSLLWNFLQLQGSGGVRKKSGGTRIFRNFQQI